MVFHSTPREIETVGDLLRALAEETTALVDHSALSRHVVETGAFLAGEFVRHHCLLCNITSNRSELEKITVNIGAHVMTAPIVVHQIGRNLIYEITDGRPHKFGTTAHELYKNILCHILRLLSVSDLITDITEHVVVIFPVGSYNDRI